MGDLPKELSKIFLEIAKEYGAFIGLAVMVIVFFSFLIVYLMRTTIKTFKDEVKRLAEERNRLLDHLLNSRISSLDNPNQHKEDKSNY